jgi:hypothetical protein
MLNRTNRTLSANTNRLNLGTRKLDLNASGNNGSLTLRTVPTSPEVFVRTGFGPYLRFIIEGPAIPEPKPMKPTMGFLMSGSSTESSRPAQGFWAWDQGQTVVSSQPGQPLGSSLRDTLGRSGSVRPLIKASLRHSRTSLDRHCDRPRRAGRSARAALALVTGATPAS